MPELARFYKIIKCSIRILGSIISRIFMLFMVNMKHLSV